jgi:hypothetical protein
MILYLKAMKNQPKKLLGTINSFSKVAGCKISLQKSAVLQYTNNEQTEKVNKKIIPFTMVFKNT